MFLHGPRLEIDQILRTFGVADMVAPIHSVPKVDHGNRLVTSR
jgi:hypothetical protein